MGLLLGYVTNAVARLLRTNGSTLASNLHMDASSSARTSTLG